MKIYQRTDRNTCYVVSDDSMSFVYCGIEFVQEYHDRRVMPWKGVNSPIYPCYGECTKKYYHLHWDAPNDYGKIVQKSSWPVVDVSDLYPDITGMIQIGI